MGPTPRDSACPRSGLDALSAVLRRLVGCGRRKDAVIDRAGLANEASPLQLGFGTNRTISLTCSPALDRWDASLRRCEDYASRLNDGFPPGPGQTRCARPASIARAGRWQPRYDRILLKYQEVVMEATSGLEPE